MKAHILFAPLVVALTTSSALAQSATGTNFTTAPVASTPAPAPGTTAPAIGQPRVTIPPAARSGESGLRIGEGAPNGDQIEMKRKK